MISNRSVFLSEKIKFLNFKTIKGKLAQYFLQISGSGDSVTTLTMTQSDLADYFGVARPSIARVVSELESEGMIETRGRSLRILDREKLVMLTRE
jgi:CRP-like cAMP-binding protein